MVSAGALSWTFPSMSALAAIAERDGTYVTLQGVIDKPRTGSSGTPHSLGIGFAEFTSIFCMRCTDNDHINIRESKASQANAFLSSLSELWSGP